MKHLLILTVGICLLLTSVPLMADQAADEAAIRKAEEMYLAAYNAKDPVAAHATYVEDVEVWRGHLSGRAAATKAMADNFAGRAKNVKVKVENEIGIVFITPDVAIYKAVLSASGRVDEEGKALPPAKNLYAKVYVKKNGKWLGAHGYFSRPIEQ